MFDNIAARYDLVNRVTSFGMDRGWRRRAVRALELGAGSRVIDVATGTGDVAIAIARHFGDATVVGIDPSPGMLEVAREKLGTLAERIELARGDAQALPFPDAAFDGAIIAFGIRNVPDRPRALAEMARVTRAGGHVVVLELSEPEPGFVGSMARLHVHQVVPRLGAWLSRAPEYRYLEQSIAAFPPPAEFGRVMEGAGLELVRIEKLGFGACHLFVARARDAK
jgi:demethylmenaquinone methyltransferase/2-methoxy-6-polyprenyl-1,4-benzoquinol methylase